MNKCTWQILPVGFRANFIIVYQFLRNEIFLLIFTLQLNITITNYELLWLVTDSLSDHGLRLPELFSQLKIVEIDHDFVLRELLWTQWREIKVWQNDFETKSPERDTLRNFQYGWLSLSYVGFQSLPCFIKGAVN